MSGVTRLRAAGRPEPWRAWRHAFAPLAAGLILLVFLPPPAYSQYHLPAGTTVPQSPQPAQRRAEELSQAEDKIAQKDFAAAEPLLAAYLKTNPSDARALYDLGYVEQAQHQAAQAEASYRKAIAANPKQFESRLALGMILAGQGKTDEARTQLKQATLLTPSPPDPDARAQAFRALAALDRTSDPEAARTALLSALRLSPETPEDLLLTAQIAEAEQDDSTAEEAYRRLIAGQPGTSLARQATGGLVHLLIEQRKYAEAEQTLKAALAPPAGLGKSTGSQTAETAGNSAADAALEAQLAVVLIAQGKNKEAVPALERLAALEPDDPAVERMLADAYAQAGFHDKAEPLYARLAALHPNDPDILFSQGKNLVEAGNYPLAQQVLEQAVKLKPDDGDAWSGLAFAAFQNKQYPETIRALSMRAKYLPDTAATFFLWAISYDNLHQAGPARAYYRKFLAADGGKLPDQEWQAKQRLKVLERSH